MSRDKKALLLSPCFLPSNYASVHRVRILAARLQGAGWSPIIVTANSRYYEEQCQPALLSLTPPGVQLETVSAWPAKLFRLFGLGDISLRAQWALRNRVAEMVHRGEADLIFVTVLPGYTGLIGAWAKRTFALPFVLDYQDPWVSDWGAQQPRLSKAGISHWLATKLEPRMVSAADAVTTVSDDTLRTLRERNLLRPKLPIETIPIGADANDHVVAARVGRSWIERRENEFVILYTGTVIAGMLPSVRTLFRAVCAMMHTNPKRKPQIHFIGTSAQPDGKDSLGLARLADELGVGALFRIEPRRIGYLDALCTMRAADVLLMLGSQDSHYTASKIFPCWLSGKPVLALFHSASTVNQLARELGGVKVVSYDSEGGAETKMEAMRQALLELMQGGLSALRPRNGAAFEPYSARGVARRYAALFDRVHGNRVVTI